MNITEGRELKKKLLTSLTEPAFLKKAGLTKHTMLTDLAKAGINQLAADLEEQILRAEVKDEQSPVDPKAVLAVYRGALEYFRTAMPATTRPVCTSAKSPVASTAGSSRPKCIQPF